MGSIVSKAFGPGGIAEELVRQIQAQEQQTPTRLPIDRLYSPTTQQPNLYNEQGKKLVSDSMVKNVFGPEAYDGEQLKAAFGDNITFVSDDYYNQQLNKQLPVNITYSPSTTVSTPMTVSGDTGLGSLLSQFAEKLFPEGQFQQIKEQATSPEMYNILSNADLARNISNQLGEVPTIGPALKTAFNVVAPVAAGIMSLPYDAIQAAQRSNLSGSSFLESYGRERPVQSAIQRAVGASAPLAEQITPRATFDPSQFKKIEPASFANGGVATLFRKR